MVKGKDYFAKNPFSNRVGNILVGPLLKGPCGSQIFNEIQGCANVKKVADIAPDRDVDAN